MRAVVQRAKDAQVSVDGEVLGAFDGSGLVILIGVTHTDTPVEAKKIAKKLYELRIFQAHHASCDPDDDRREFSAAELGLPVMVISQFTLYGDTRKGRRPTWTGAAPGPIAEPLVNEVIACLRELGAAVSTGRFGADMQVTFTNDGPMTILLEQDSPEGSRLDR
jgi:D-tyrosyl-tRNA(Tyr) deacylase